MKDLTSQRIEDINCSLELFYKLFSDTENFTLQKSIKCLTITELHVIEAISNEKLPMKILAKKLNITLGTATTAISKLLAKGFVERNRSEKDRRIVYVSLSDKGLSILNFHTIYHTKLISNIVKNIPDKEMGSFLKTFNKLIDNLKIEMNMVKPTSLNSFSIDDSVIVVNMRCNSTIKKFLNKNGVNTHTVLKVKDSTEEDIIVELEDESTMNISLEDAKDIIGVKDINYLDSDIDSEDTKSKCDF